MFNIKQFMEDKLNDGSTYKSSDGCGCIKGNIAAAYGLSKYNGHYILGWLADNARKEHTACDIAETMLIKGFPEKAKMFILLMAERYNLFNDISPSLAESAKEVSDSTKICDIQSSWKSRGKVIVYRSPVFTSAVDKVKTRLPVKV